MTTITKTPYNISSPWLPGNCPYTASIHKKNSMSFLHFLHSTTTYKHAKCNELIIPNHAIPMHGQVPLPTANLNILCSHDFHSFRHITTSHNKLDKIVSSLPTCHTYTRLHTPIHTATLQHPHIHSFHHSHTSQHLQTIHNI